MSEQPDLPDQPTMVPNTDPDPFQGDSVQLKVTKEVALGQLVEEISRRVKREVQTAFVISPPERIASEEEPATLYVSPGSLSEKVLQEVLDKHVPRPVLPSQPAEPTPEPAPPPPVIDLESLPEDIQALVQRLREGDTLKTSELSDVLRAVLGIEPEPSA